MGRPQDAGLLRHYGQLRQSLELDSRFTYLSPRNNGGDHAGKIETSDLWALRPELIRAGKNGTSDDWFTDTAKEASPEYGAERINQILEYWDSVL